MERRKVQQTGSSTFTISLPKGWACEHGIEPGMQLALRPHDDGSLVIGTGDRHEGTPTVDLTGASSDTVRRTVEACYRLGYDRVSLVATDGFDDEPRRAVSRAVNGLSGFEVVDENEGRVTLGCLLATSEVSIDRSVVQLQYVALSTLGDAVSALTADDRDLARHVADRSEDADRRAAVVGRYFERTLRDHETLDELGLTRSTMVDYHVAADQLGSVAAAAEALTEPVQRDVDAPDEWTETTKTLVHRIRSLVEDAVEVLFDGDDPSVAHDVRARAADVAADVDAFDTQLYAAADPAAPAFGIVTDGLATATRQADGLATRAAMASLRRLVSRNGE